MYYCPYLIDFKEGSLQSYAACGEDGKAVFYDSSGGLINKDSEGTPIQNGKIYFYDEAEDEWIEATCSLWDDVNKRCGLKVSDTIRNNNDNETNTLITLLEKVLGKNSERDNDHSLHQYLQDVLGKHENKEEAAIGETLLTLFNHIHDSHHHKIAHVCPDIPVDCGDGVVGIGFATTLIGEFHHNQDLDGNDKIYGKDFKIKDDPEKPPILKTLEFTQTWVEPTETMTWGEYVEFAEGEE